MFPSSFLRSARAFSGTTTAARMGGQAVRRQHQQQHRGRAGPSVVARSMSGGADTTVVDVCTQKIRDALDATDVQVQGAYDDPNGSHISIQVVSAKFEGKRAVQRQQLVYKAIWEELQGPVHAVDSMVCKTPDEA